MKRAAAVFGCMLAVNVHAAGRVSGIDAQVEQAARRALAEQAAREGLARPVVEKIVVKTNSPARACRQAVTVDAVDIKHPNRMRFVALCPDAEGGKQDFIVRAELSAEVVVALNAIPSGRAIRDVDVALQRHELSGLQDGTSDVDAVVGQTSRRSLQAGDIVNKQLLISPLLVKRGALVRIVASSGGVEVSASGETLDAGRLNEVVRVRNVATGKVIRARVKGGDMVEPADMPISSQSRD
jgi:flagella basal body P-ring formation protein FlgA